NRKRIVTRHAETVVDVLISNSLDDVINYRSRFHSCHFFLKLSKIDILENLRFLARSFSASCVLTCPVESKPNSKITKTKMIGVMLMACSIIDKKSPRPACRPEHRATDLRRRTRMKRPAWALGAWICLHTIFLKRSKIDISGNLRFSSEYCERRTNARVVCNFLF